MSKKLIISRKPELYKNGEKDLKAAKAYRKEINKILRDIQKVQQTIGQVGRHKIKVIEQLKKKHNAEEVNRMFKLYIQMIDANEWK